MSPGYVFFYGTLMDPKVLQAVLDIAELPVMEQGYITGFSVKMWGIYPALVSSSDAGARVLGTFWKVDNGRHMMKLSRYETAAYRTTPVTIFQEDGNRIENGRVFCWSGDSESRDLEDGSFDLTRYKTFFKKSVVKAA
jgi:gamma-glutamylcyclotransferase (GGCT)/AIG2-like uncharacterized protein YtfP